MRAHSCAVQYDEAARAYLERNHSHLGHRYIELFLQSAET